MRLLISSLLCCALLLLVACQNNSNEHVQENNANAENTEEKESHVNEGKQEKEVDDIYEATIYEWKLEQDIHIYLTKADGEVLTYEDTTALGKKGQEYFEGSVEFYLVYDGDDVGYLQDTIEDVRVDLAGRNVEEFSIQKDQFLGWVTPEASNVYDLYLFALIEEELVQVTFNDDDDTGVVSSKDIKPVEDTYIQEYMYVNDPSALGYHFTTYDWDRERNNLVTRKRFQLFSEEPEEILKKWHKDEEFYLPYGRYTFDEESVNELKEGSMFINDIKIGQDIEEVVSIKGEPTDEFYEAGAPAYHYNEDNIIYVYDEIEGNILSLIIEGGHISNTLDQLIEVLGEPEEDTYSELDQLNMAIFEFGDYSLIALYDEYDNIVEVSLH